EIVRAALRDGVDGGAHAAAVLRVVLRADDLELFDGGLRERERRTRAAGLLAEEVVVRARTVDVVVGGERTRAVRGDRVHVERARADARRERRERAEVTSEERQVFDLLRGDRGREAGALGVDDRRSGGDRDRFADRRRELDVRARRVAE